MSGIHNFPNYNIAFNLRNKATQEAIEKDTYNERITKTYEAIAPLNEIGSPKAGNNETHELPDVVLERTDTPKDKPEGIGSPDADSNGTEEFDDVELQRTDTPKDKPEGIGPLKAAHRLEVDDTDDDRPIEDPNVPL